MHARKLTGFRAGHTRTSIYHTTPTKGRRADWNFRRAAHTRPTDARLGIALPDGSIQWIREGPVERWAGWPPPSADMQSAAPTAPRPIQDNFLTNWSLVIRHNLCLTLFPAPLTIPGGDSP